MLYVHTESEMFHDSPVSWDTVVRKPQLRKTAGELFDALAGVKAGAAHGEISVATCLLLWGAL